MSSPECDSNSSEVKKLLTKTNKSAQPDVGVYIPRFKRVEKAVKYTGQPSKADDTNDKVKNTSTIVDIPQPRRGRDFDATSLRVYPDSTQKKPVQKNYRTHNKGSTTSQASFNQNRQYRTQTIPPKKTSSEKKTSQPGTKPSDMASDNTLSDKQPEHKLSEDIQKPEPSIEELTKSIEQLSTNDAHTDNQLEKVPLTPKRTPAPGRPVTSDLVARRLIGNILGIKVTKSKEALELEKKKLADARAQRLAKKKQEAKRLEESEKTFLE